MSSLYLRAKSLERRRQRFEEEHVTIYGAAEHGACTQGREDQVPTETNRRTSKQIQNENKKEKSLTFCSVKTVG